MQESPLSKTHGQPQPIDKVIKLLILGNPKCGKSSLISRYVNGSFDDKYKSTIGADFVRKDLLIPTPDSNRNLRVRLQLWDIAGQDRFQKMTRAYFSGAKGVAIVCDVSREGTVEAVRCWKEEVDSWIDQSGCDASIPIVLFANKADMLSDAIEACRIGATMERVCREQGFQGWYVTSAKLGDCVDDGFQDLVCKIVQSETSGKDAAAKRGFKLTLVDGSVARRGSSRSGALSGGGCFS